MLGTLDQEAAKAGAMPFERRQPDVRVVLISVVACSTLVAVFVWWSTDDIALSALAACIPVMASTVWLLTQARAQSRGLRRELASQDGVLNGILTSSPLAIIDRSGAILRISHAACAMFGVGETSPIGRPITDYIPGFSIDAVHNPTGLLKDRDTRPPTWTGARRGTESFPLAIEVGALPGEGGHFVLSLADLEAWSAADTRAAELQAQLAVVSRLDSMGRMAAIIAHELNQPLAAAGIYLHAARKDIALCGTAGQSAERTINLAKHQVLRAGEIIRKMRDLLSHGTLTLEPDRVSTIVVDLLPITDLKVRDGKATIRYDIDMTSDRVLAERIQIQQAVINLINNAVDAVRGRPRRDVVVRGRALSDILFEIAVEDSGPGIDPDRMDDLFRPLTSTKKDGMGLGLSIVRTIVESHGGTLSVRRSDLGGATFCFTLKRA